MVNLNHLEDTTAFPHLERTVTYNNSDCVELYSNLSKSQSIWEMLAKVMGRMGDPIKFLVMMYKVVVTDAMITVL